MPVHRRNAPSAGLTGARRHSTARRWRRLVVYTPNGQVDCARDGRAKEEDCSEPGRPYKEARRSPPTRSKGHSKGWRLGECCQFRSSCSAIERRPFDFGCERRVERGELATDEDELGTENVFRLARRSNDLRRTTRVCEELGTPDRQLGTELF